MNVIKSKCNVCGKFLVPVDKLSHVRSDQAHLVCRCKTIQIKAGPKKPVESSTEIVDDVIFENISKEITGKSIQKGEWFYRNSDGKSVGPFSISEMRRLSKVGIIVADTFIRNGNGNNWHPVKKTMDFSFPCHFDKDNHSSGKFLVPTNRLETTTSKQKPFNTKKFIVNFILIMAAYFLVTFLVLKFTVFNKNSDSNDSFKDAFNTNRESKKTSGFSIDRNLLEGSLKEVAKRDLQEVREMFSDFAKRLRQEGRDVPVQFQIDEGFESDVFPSDSALYPFKGIIKFKKRKVTSDGASNWSSVVIKYRYKEGVWQHESDQWLFDIMEN